MFLTSYADSALTANLLSTLKDWDLLHQRYFCAVFARLLCSAGITNENEFHTALIVLTTVPHPGHLCEQQLK